MRFYILVGAKGFEPSTPCSQSRCANQAALRPDVCFFGGAGGTRTPDLFRAKETRSLCATAPLAIFIVSAPLVACQV